ncbi:EamA family transporter [Streptomyces sp. 8K308]|uniref:DMT family transporter n=1 Tax=Streptomyces sp. 8K308 TaxID=2530388 RepID=UPI001042FEDA|nr:EamA family transporter [Streptomyces sp. 8K308]TDC21917.1 EamA family transporter [Streptomyces sp. 8K308]
MSTSSSHPSPTHVSPVDVGRPAAGRRTHAGPALVLGASALWGTTGTVANLAPAGASPLAVGAATMGFGGLLTVAIAARRTLTVLRGGRAVLPYVLFGALGVVAYPLSFYTSMAWTGVAVGTVVSVGSAPMFAALLERLLDGVRLTRRWLAATTAAAVGCAALVFTGDGAADTAGDDRVQAGVALGLLAGVGYAAYTYCAARIIGQGHPSRGAMGALFGLATLVLLPVFAVTGGQLAGSARGVAVIAYLALIPMCLAYVLFGAGLARVSASTATTLSLFEPVVAAVLGVAVVGERLGAAAWAGIGLVVAGLFVLTVRRR